MFLPLLHALPMLIHLRLFRRERFQRTGSSNQHSTTALPLLDVRHNVPRRGPGEQANALLALSDIVLVLLYRNPAANPTSPLRIFLISLFCGLLPH